MYVHCVPIKGAPLSSTTSEGVEEPASLDNLVAYNSSKIATRYFCSKCSAHVLFHSHGETNNHHWSVFTGTLEKTEGITSIGEHIFVSDTLDGGLADHYRTEGGKLIPRYSEHSGSVELPLGWKADKISSKADVETLPLHCHCKAISLSLTRATEIKDPKTEYWLVPGKGENAPIRFCAGHCVCKDCRLAGGNQIQSWIIVPKPNVIDSATGLPVDLEEKRPQGLKQYESSPGKYRESCGTCGAKVFWWKVGDPNVDVSAGLIDEEVGGVKSEKWIYWYERVVHPDDAINAGTVASLLEGLNATGN